MLNVLFMNAAVFDGLLIFMRRCIINAIRQVLIPYEMIFMNDIWFVMISYNGLLMPFIGKF